MSDRWSLGEVLVATRSSVRASELECALSPHTALWDLRSVLDHHHDPRSLLCDLSCEWWEHRDFSRFSDDQLIDMISRRIKSGSLVVVRREDIRALRKRRERASLARQVKNGERPAGGGMIPGSPPAAPRAQDRAEPEPATAPAEPAPEEICNKSVPAMVVGDCEYYQRRHDNFLGRHRGCPHSPPQYYLEYGKKYCVRFSTELYPNLTEKGKAWLGRARVNLQLAIEAGLSENPPIELNDQGFTTFAFGTHANAYWNAGLHDVPLTDKAKIALTPDAKEWLQGETWKQAADVAGREARATADDAATAAKQVADDVKQFFRELLR
jgi:hypothetical protein